MKKNVTIYRLSIVTVIQFLFIPILLSSCNIYRERHYSSFAIYTNTRQADSIRRDITKSNVYILDKANKTYKLQNVSLSDSNLTGDLAPIDSVEIRKIKRPRWYNRVGDKRNIVSVKVESTIDRNSKTLTIKSNDIKDVASYKKLGKGVGLVPWWYYVSRATVLLFSFFVVCIVGTVILGTLIFETIPLWAVAGLVGAPLLGLIILLVGSALTK